MGRGGRLDGREGGWLVRMIGGGGGGCGGRRGWALVGGCRVQVVRGGWFSDNVLVGGVNARHSVILRNARCYILLLLLAFSLGWFATAVLLARASSVLGRTVNIEWHVLVKLGVALVYS